MNSRDPIAPCFGLRLDRKKNLRPPRGVGLTQATGGRERAREACVDAIDTEAWLARFGLRGSVELKNCVRCAQSHAAQAFLRTQFTRCGEGARARVCVRARGEGHNLAVCKVSTLVVATSNKCCCAVRCGRRASHDVSFLSTVWKARGGEPCANKQTRACLEDLKITG
eukprot:364416-Chlamydomonas_euryale.AAC.4